MFCFLYSLPSKLYCSSEKKLFFIIFHLKFFPEEQPQSPAKVPSTRDQMQLPLTKDNVQNETTADDRLRRNVTTESPPKIRKLLNDVISI